MSMDRKVLLERMKKLAAAYTPEWRFDEEHPDVATALALIWAEMFEGTISRYDRLSMKNKIAFFDTMGTRLHPSVPADGYVTFGMSSSEFGGTEVPEGFMVLVGNSENGEEVSFETQDNVYVTPVTLEEILLTDGYSDRIQQIYEKPEQEQKGSSPFYLFHSDRKNLQEHLLYLGQDEVLNLSAPAKVFLHIQTCGPSKEDDAGIEWLTEEAAVFEYYTENGFMPFGRKYLEGDKLVLELLDGQLPFARSEWRDGQEYVIRCRILKPYVKDDFVVEWLGISSEAAQLLPDTVQTENGEEELRDIRLFGDQPAPFREVYIASEQALSKAGAKISLSFHLKFEKILSDSPAPQEREWKLVMKKSDFAPDPEYDVTIKQVVWEYYNGTGWARLFSDDRYSNLFNGGDDTLGQRITIEFVCPNDIRPFLLNSVESRYLRIRVLKMDNLFKPRGNYIIPIIDDIRLSFTYEGSGKTPNFLETFNNHINTRFPIRQMGLGKVHWPLFRGLRDRRKSLYMRFSGPFESGPIKMLFTMEESIRETLPRLEFEYWGSGGFQPLSAVDGTDRFSKSGVLTFMGKGDFQRMQLWGREGYWIRIIDADEGYRERPVSARSPMVNGFFMNAARVREVRTMPEERFRIEPKEKNKICTLLHPNIQSIEVWIDERASLPQGHLNELKKERGVEEECSADGSLEHLWVKWTEVENFYFSGYADRHYVVERNQGTVTFSDGVAGAIPSSGDTETIRICYTCGGGKCGNQPAGSINQMSRTLGFINRVTNPCITSGGSDQETLQEAVSRQAGRLCHGGRAVTANDFEALAVEASRSVLKVKCFPNCSESGDRKSGDVTLVVLQKNFKDGRLYFEQVKQEVLNYIRPRLPGDMAALGRFHVVEPTFLEFRCFIEISVRDFKDVFEVRHKVLERLEEFLDPICGNFNKHGWEIGKIPNEIQINNAIKGISGILFVRNVRMATYIQSRQGWVEVDRASAQESPFGVALSGEHQIIISVENR